MHSERGTGLFGTVLGVGIFLTLMLVAVQVLTHLYATSVVEAAAYDAIQAVSRSSSSERAAAEADARSLLGPMSDTTTFLWGSDGDDVVLRVVAERGGVWRGEVARTLGLDVIEREFRMRKEQFR